MSKYSSIDAAGAISAAESALSELKNNNLQALNDIGSSLSEEVAGNVGERLNDINSEINNLKTNLNNVIDIASKILRYQELEKEVEALEQNKYVDETYYEKETNSEGKEEIVKKIRKVTDLDVVTRIAELTREMASIEPSIA